MIVVIIMYDVFYKNNFFLWSLIKSISTKQKYIINARITKIFIKEFYFFSSHCVRMSGNSRSFDDEKINISDYYKNKNKKIFNKNDIDVNKILVSKKISYGKNSSFKYFIGYNDNDIIRPLFVKVTQTTSYINKFKDKKHK